MRPVSKRTVRVPKRPLSITASANWISGPSTGALLFREGAGRPRAIFDRGHRTLLRGSGSHYRGPDRADRRGVVVQVLRVRAGTACSCVFSRALAPRHTSPDPVVGPGWWKALSAQAEPLDDAAVAVDVDLLEVTEKATTLTDEQQQTAAAVVVVLVGLEVLREVLDALREHRDLDLGGTGVTLVGGVLGHDGLLDGTFERHSISWLTRCAVRRGISTRALSVRGRSDGPQRLSGRGRGPRTGVEDHARAVDVGVHLHDQVVDRLEAQGGTQTLDQLEHHHLV